MTAENAPPSDDPEARPVPRFHAASTRRLIGTLASAPKEHANSDGTSSWRFAIYDRNRIHYAVESPVSPNTRSINGDLKPGEIIDMTGHWTTARTNSNGKAAEIPVFSPNHASVRQRDGSLASQLHDLLDTVVSRAASYHYPVIVADNPIKDPRGRNYDPVPSIETVLNAEEKKRRQEQQHESGEDLPFGLGAQHARTENETHHASSEEDLPFGIGKRQPHADRDPAAEYTSGHTDEPERARAAREQPRRNTFLIVGRILTEPVQKGPRTGVWTFETSQDHLPGRRATVHLDLERTDLPEFEKVAFSNARAGDAISMIGTWSKSRNDTYTFSPTHLQTDATDRAWTEMTNRPRNRMPEPDIQPGPPKKTRRRYQNAAGLD